MIVIGICVLLLLAGLAMTALWSGLDLQPPRLAERGVPSRS
ncbi:MAG TPA: hypothetical protein VI006_19985 [Solirubrobacteraceae bacterium]|jgi:hypothetical protein